MTRPRQACGTPRVRRSAASALIALVALPAFVACSSTSSTASTSARPSATGTALSRLEREARSPDPNFDFGQTIQITATGFHPMNLVAPCCDPITWRNLSSTPNSVVVPTLGLSSGTIPPGGTYVLKPHNVQTIGYYSGVDPKVTGGIQVNQLQEP